MLNEVSRRSIDGIRAAAPGYSAWRDPAARAAAPAGASR